MVESYLTKEEIDELMLVNEIDSMKPVRREAGPSRLQDFAVLMRRKRERKEMVEEKVIEFSEIIKLREMTEADAREAARRLKQSASEPQLISHRKCGVFDLYVVLSGIHAYEVVRFMHFIRCTCPSFELGHQFCKHCAFCMPTLCFRCFKQTAPLGEVCNKCRTAEFGSIQVKPQSPEAAHV